VSRRPIDSDLVRSAARRFGLDPDGLSFVRDVANAVYESGDRFLRFTHASDHSEQHVRAEIEWLEFLVAEGMPVCRPVATRDGEPVWAAGAGLTAAVFERVRGRPVEEEEYEEPIFEQVGAFLGRLHRVSQAFVPRDPACVRPHARELDPLERILGSWSSDDRVVARVWPEVFERVHAAPGEPGLIHGDVHRGNITVHEGGIDVFDFDDSCRFLLVADVANALYYSLWFHRHEPDVERARRAERFLRPVLRGYRRERPLDDADLALLPELLEYRELTVDAFSHRRRPEPDDDVKRRYRQVRERIARGAPYVDLDSVL